MSRATRESDGTDARVTILLKEYDTLRTEIASRINNRFAIVGFVVALVTLAGSQSDMPVFWRCILASAALGISMVVWWRLGQLIKRCSRRIADIEERINALMGEDLLIWESQLAKQSLFHKVYRKLS